MSVPKFAEVSDDLMIAVAWFRASRPGRRAVLVLDNINLITAEGGPALLRILQEFSEIAADKNLLKMILSVQMGLHNPR